MTKPLVLALALSLAAAAAFAQTGSTPPPRTPPPGGTAGISAGVSVGVDVLGGLDADNDGLLSRTEVQGNLELSKRFKRLDKNNDGQLSPDEYSQYSPKPGLSPGGVGTGMETEGTR